MIVSMDDSLTTFCKCDDSGGFFINDFSKKRLITIHDNIGTFYDWESFKDFGSKVQMIFATIEEPFPLQFHI